MGRIGVLGAAAALAVLAAALPALAQGAGAPLRVTLGHAEVITLDAAAATLLLANPEIADIVNERGNLVFVLGKKPGATNLLVYDAQGRRLVDREVVVVPQERATVSVARDIDVGDYLCDPRCTFVGHAPSAATPGSGGGTAGASAAAGPAGAGAANALPTPTGPAAPAAPATAGVP